MCFYMQFDFYQAIWLELSISLGIKLLSVVICFLIVVKKATDGRLFCVELVVITLTSPN